MNQEERDFITSIDGTFTAKALENMIGNINDPYLAFLAAGYLAAIRDIIQGSKEMPLSWNQVEEKLKRWKNQGMTDEEMIQGILAKL